MFTQAVAQELAAKERIVIICGRYEGVDERVSEGLADREISIGDYVLSGGELGAAVLVDAVTLVHPGSAGQRSFSPAGEFDRFAKHRRGRSGQHLRLRRFAGLSALHATGRVSGDEGIPVVLMGGNHEQISVLEYAARRLKRHCNIGPYLLENQPLSAEDKKIIAEIERSRK